MAKSSDLALLDMAGDLLNELAPKGVQTISLTVDRRHGGFANITMTGGPAVYMSGTGPTASEALLNAEARAAIASGAVKVFAQAEVARA